MPLVEIAEAAGRAATAAVAATPARRWRRVMLMVSNPLFRSQIVLPELLPAREDCGAFGRDRTQILPIGKMSPLGDTQVCEGNSN